MANATYNQTSFLGGEWSRSVQGRSDRPDYRTAMNVCLNSLPIEEGAWTRRSGTRHAGATRSGGAGRVVQFSYKETAPFTIEFTDGHIRARSGANLVGTNDATTVSSISSASPAVMALSAATTWATGDRGYFEGVDVGSPILLNRVFELTYISTTQFSLADALTGTAIDGSTIGTLASGVTFKRILDIISPYVNSGWQSLRSVQAERQAVMLQSLVAPQVLTASPPAVPGDETSFALTTANFKDGPYLDPFTNGVQATPSAKTGIIQITLAFAGYDAAKAYSVGDYVTSSSVNYRSLVDQNVNNTPASSPAAWVAVSAGEAIGPNQFVSSDIGRHVRLYSEPSLWAVGSSYTAGNIVSYNGVNWTALASSTGSIPGNDATKWGVNANAALWTWGRVTGLLNQIPANPASTSNIGDLSGLGGLVALFDGNLNKTSGNCANRTGGGLVPGGNVTRSYGGKNFSGGTPAGYAVQSATVFPSLDQGFIRVQVAGGSGYVNTMQFNLYGKQTAPSGSTDGTLLGTSYASGPFTSPVTIASSDTATVWEYLWVEMVSTVTVSGASGTVNHYVCQIQWTSPQGTGTSGGIFVEILGPALLYTTSIRTWRLGAYSGKTGWPTCGTYHEGRLWLSGVVDNRLDASKPNDLFNFSPTEPDGTVTDANAISYTFNAPDVNAIYWMEPDQQGIICGTQAGEWLVQATANNNILTPTNIQAHRVTKIGCANIPPQRAEHTTVFVQKHKRKIMEYFADVFSGKFSAPNLSFTGKHMTKPLLAELAYQQELAPVIWSRCEDGSLHGITYKRESLMSSKGPDFAGHHRHELGSGRTVESICAGPAIDGNLSALTMVTNDAATGIRHVEILENLFEDGDVVADGWYLDNAVQPAVTQSISLGGTSYFRLHGLWHLNGKTVSVSAGGLDLGDYAVADGYCSVPFGAADGLFTPAFVASFNGDMPVVAGFTFTSDGQTVRPATPEESGARLGPALGKKRRSHHVAALLRDTQGVSVGTDFSKLRPLRLGTDGGTAYAQNVLFSGVVSQELEDDYGFDSMLCWRITRPNPATICSIGAYLSTQDQ